MSTSLTSFLSVLHLNPRNISSLYIFSHLYPHKQVSCLATGLYIFCWVTCILTVSTSLCTHTRAGMGLYKSVIHHSRKLIPVWERILNTGGPLTFLQPDTHRRGGERRGDRRWKKPPPASSCEWLPVWSSPSLTPGIERSREWQMGGMHNTWTLLGGGWVCVFMCAVGPQGVDCGVIIDLMVVF